MTGMKKGAGEDPFAEDTDDADLANESNDTTKSKTAASNTTEGDTGSEKAMEETSEKAMEEAQETHETRRRNRSMQIPYKFRRDGVQDGRDRVPLFLQNDTKTAERDTLRELEERFDDDVSLTDLREALVKVGAQHLDEVEAQLEEWGYGMTFEE